MSVPIAANAVNLFDVRNQVIPDEGPKCVSLIVDFPSFADGVASLDLSNYQERGAINQIQCMFVDAKDSTISFDILFDGSGQVIRVKQFTQGYYTVISPNPVRLTFSGSGVPVPIKIFLLNVPLPACVWDTQ
jgi:hypothetical protein